MSSLPVASLGPATTAGPGISAEALVALRTDMLRFAQLQLRKRPDGLKIFAGGARRAAEEVASLGTLFS